MIPVLGYPLSDAVKRLEESGYAVLPVEARSRKGVSEGEKRVVRQRQLDDTAVELSYSTFKMKLNMP